MKIVLGTTFRALLLADVVIAVVLLVGIWAAHNHLLPSLFDSSELQIRQAGHLGRHAGALLITGALVMVAYDFHQATRAKLDLSRQKGTMRFAEWSLMFLGMVPFFGLLWRRSVERRIEESIRQGVRSGLRAAVLQNLMRLSYGLWIGMVAVDII